MLPLDPGPSVVWRVYIVFGQRVVRIVLIAEVAWWIVFRVFPKSRSLVGAGPQKNPGLEAKVFL